MSGIEIFILGLALSMDAFAVTVSNLMCYPQLSRSRQLALPLTFGLFQGLMPVIGFFLGSVAAELVDTFAGPLALLILGFIGGKMIFDSVKTIRAQRASEARYGADSAKQCKNPAKLNAQIFSRSEKELSIPSILMQGVATSLDALIVGVSLFALKVPLFKAVSIITLTTFACCFVGLFIGRRFGTLFGSKAQIAGGVILIAIGIKVCFF